MVTKDATYAVYMPGKNYGEIAAKLLEGGLDVTTPCVIVANATQAEEQIQRTTLQELALETRLAAPSLLIVGKVARPLPPIDDDKETPDRETPQREELLLDLSETRAEEEIIG